MCGISAFFGLGGPSSSSTAGDEAVLSPKEGLEKSLRMIKYRGPDATGTWFSPNGQVGLGHVRLAIVDISPAGNQPFVDDQDGIVAVVNGELYEHEEYREQLAHEHIFKGKSDCEIVIAVYKHYGVSFLSHLKGEFALVLWDQKRQLLLAARDRYGIKSLYYTIHENHLLVATEMKCFLEFGWKPQWFVETLRSHSWQFGRHTFFRHVYKILPGHYLLCRGYGADVQQIQYWDCEYPDKGNLETRSEAEMVDGVRGRLMQAVRLRLQADVPVGVYLSGGLDSSSVAGLIAHLIRHEGVRLGNDGSGDLSQLHCFTVQFDKETGADESEVAQRTADWLGAHFHPVYMDEDALATRFEDAAWYSENPFADVNGICKLALSEKVHSLGMKVVITGEGSDEHFGGYSDFRPDSIQERDESWPQSHFPDSERLAAWHKALGDTGATTFGDGEFEVPLSTRRMVNHTSTIKTVARVGHLPFASWTGQCAAAGDPETVLAESVDGRVRDKMANIWHPLNTSAYIWIKSFMPSVILRYCGDNMDMANSMESRLPFLDHCLTEYANQLPPSLKMKYDPETGQFDEKYILRQAMKPFITSEIFSQRKRKFSGPTHYAVGGPIHQTLQRLLTRENIAKLGFLDADLVQDYLLAAFYEKDGTAFRNSMLVAQFVVVAKRFRVAMARPA